MSAFYDVNSDVVDVIRLRADGAMSKGDLAEIVAPDEAGEVLGAKTPVDENGVDRLVVALHAVADNAIGLFAVRGPVDLTVPTLTITAYHGLKFHNGAIASTSAGASVSGREANNDFAVALEAGVAATTLRVFLIGEPVTKST
jgi:hypothetical protein